MIIDRENNKGIFNYLFNNLRYFYVFMITPFSNFKQNIINLLLQYHNGIRMKIFVETTILTHCYRYFYTIPNYRFFDLVNYF